MVHVLLTDQGIAQYEEVILRCFQALRRIEQLEIPEYMLKKLQYMEDSQFQAIFDDSFDYVMRISSELVDEEMQTFPDLTYTSSEKALDMTKSLLLEMNPFQCLYFLVANPEEVGVRLSRIEKWMGSEYAMRKIAEHKLKEWYLAQPHLSIGFQPEEELPAPKGDPIFIETEVEEGDIPDPIFLIDDNSARIRWVEPSVAGESIDAFFCITTPAMNSSAKHVALNDIFVKGVIDEMKKEFADEEQIVWNVGMEGVDLCLFLSSPYESYQSCFQRFFSVLKKARVSQEEFMSIRQHKLDSYPGDPAPLDYAHQILDSLLRPSYYTKMELYHALLQIECEEYEKFQKNYFQEIFLEGAFLGGASKEQILQLWGEISTILGVKPSQFSKDRNKQFVFPEDSQSYLIMQKTHRKGNALLLLIESDSIDEDLEVIHKILTTVLHSEFFEELRTKQQTAYKLHTWQELMHQKICHCFGVQSSTHSPLDLLYRVEKFLLEFAMKGGEVLTLDRFEIIRESLILNAEKQKNSANTREDLAWLNQNLERLRTLQYERVIEQISNIFSSENRKRIAILIEGSSQSPTILQDRGDIQYIPIEKEYFYR
jgi:secreted Zn-dependent insulinase-like peptidase